MESTLNTNKLLPDQGSLTLRQVKADKSNWMISAIAKREAVHCPDCGVLTKAYHSSYVRRLKDLPIQGRSVELIVRVGRWRCRNRGCPRGIFCQRLPDIAPAHARQTKRFVDVGGAVAHVLGGRAGERLSSPTGNSGGSKCAVATAETLGTIAPSGRTDSGHLEWMSGPGERDRITERFW